MVLLKPPSESDAVPSEPAGSTTCAMTGTQLASSTQRTRRPPAVSADDTAMTSSTSATYDSSAGSTLEYRSVPPACVTYATCTRLPSAVPEQLGRTCCVSDEVVGVPGGTPSRAVTAPPDDAAERVPPA